jgi:hypothetical protein
VPTGGTVGGLIGVIDGAITGQIAGGQIGGRSIALSQSGCIWPSTHWQMHDAAALWALIARKTTAPTTVHIRRFMKAPGSRLRARSHSKAQPAASHPFHRRSPASSPFSLFPQAI